MAAVYGNEDLQSYWKIRNKSNVKMGQEVVLRRRGIRDAQKLGNSVLEVDPGDSCTVKLGGWVWSPSEGGS